MRVIRRNTLTGETSQMQYPREDMQPLLGYPIEYVFYSISDDKFTGVLDTRTHQLISSGEFTEDRDPRYNHLFIYRVTYSVERLPIDYILLNLDNSVGNHIEGNFPVWKQLKYLHKQVKLKSKSLTQEEAKEYLYITDLLEWCNVVRLERDNMATELELWGILPTFNFTPMPLRTDPKYS